MHRQSEEESLAAGDEEPAMMPSRQLAARVAAMYWYSLRERKRERERERERARASERASEREREREQEREERERDRQRVSE